MYLTRSITRLFAAADKAAALSASSFELEDLVWERMQENEAELRNVDPLFEGIPFQSLEELQHYSDDSSGAGQPSSLDPNSFDTDGGLDTLDQLHSTLPEYEDLNEYGKRGSTSSNDNPRKKKRKRPNVKGTGKKKGAGKSKPSDVRISEDSTPSDPQPPTVEYRGSRKEAHVRFQKKGLSMQERKQARSAARLLIPQDSLIATTGLMSITEDSRISRGSWMGINVKKDFRGILGRMLDAGEKLKGLTLLFYERAETIVCDSRGRIIIYRSCVRKDMRDVLLPKVNSEADRFIDATEGPTDADCKDNARGGHWFQISGYDRNNKAQPELSVWHKAHFNLLQDDFFAPNSVFWQLTKHGCGLVQKHFPHVYQRFKDCSDYMRDKYNTPAPYGEIFFNFCLNGRRYGPKVQVQVPRVFCRPHVDYKNVALGVCMVYVYGHFNHRERCWLVIWEAGVALELPPGVFVIYPSSLFLHFNVDLSQLEVVITQGDAPTRENSVPVYCSCGRATPDHGRAWDQADGRGSIVWFNQATMFQTAELGYNTVKAAKMAGKNTACTKSADDVFSNIKG